MISNQLMDKTHLWITLSNGKMFLIWVLSQHQPQCFEAIAVSIAVSINKREVIVFWGSLCLHRNYQSISWVCLLSVYQNIREWVHRNLSTVEEKYSFSPQLMRNIWVLIEAVNNIWTKNVMSSNKLTRNVSNNKSTVRNEVVICSHS
jgi:hypothetical protein